MSSRQLAAAALLLVAACLLPRFALGATKCRVARCLECEEGSSTLCKTCAPYVYDAMRRPKWGVVKTPTGKCRQCLACPVSKGWATCNTSGKCLTCRTDDGFRLNHLGTKCECRYEDGYRPVAGGCTKKPCRVTPMCFVEPCAVTLCPSGTTCTNVPCSCTAACIPQKRDPCPKPVQCLVDPCSIKDICPAGTRCEADYCHGGCDHRCVDDSKCDSPVACFVDPCRNNDCKPWQTCVANYCKECSYTCVDKPDRR
ncbi:hypothetical protein ABPG77_006291 [Micractinium sp. CCAP 211/92]